MTQQSSSGSSSERQQAQNHSCERHDKVYVDVVQKLIPLFEWEKRSGSEA